MLHCLRRPFAPTLLRRLAALYVLLAALGVGSDPLGGQERPADPSSQATFRTEANFVLTDVLVTKDGKPVRT